MWVGFGMGSYSHTHGDDIYRAREVRWLLILSRGRRRSTSTFAWFRVKLSKFSSPPPLLLKSGGARFGTWSIHRPPRLSMVVMISGVGSAVAPDAAGKLDQCLAIAEDVAPMPQQQRHLGSMFRNMSGGRILEREKNKAGEALSGVVCFGGFNCGVYCKGRVQYVRQTEGLRERPRVSCKVRFLVAQKPPEVAMVAHAMISLVALFNSISCPFRVFLCFRRSSVIPLSGTPAKGN
ncbi:hypothetical protein B0H63DRAFT_61670 [Podospora didyma]|uniref:Uncharacterized protein n=1 Tax=Podospora didyma TaxID=330526 RepID=A0AAE0U8G7_9PEZI|nr:hypothetical protein B0H63DRAFT_61670 [Podospora didyma]